MIHPGPHLTGQRGLTGGTEHYSLTPTSCLRADTARAALEMFLGDWGLSLQLLLERGQESAGHLCPMASMLASRDQEDCA